MPRLSLATVILALATTPAAAKDTWFYLGPRTPSAEIYNISGFGTEKAFAEARVTDEEIKEFCDNFYPGLTSCEKATRSEYPRPFTASANCVAGTIITVYGDELIFAGERKRRSEADSPNVTLWRKKDGPVLGTGPFDGGNVPAQNWSALCGVATRPHQAQVTASSSKQRLYVPTTEEWLEMLNEQPYIHNGSEVGVNFSKGYIKYWTPKPSIAGAVSSDTILFQGTFRNVRDLKLQGTITGTAYVFKKGCEPAPYSVSGKYSDGRIVMRGSAPQRDKNSCAIIGYSTKSPNAVLEFKERPEYN
jgi:hypothetical protein